MQEHAIIEDVLFTMMVCSNHPPFVLSVSLFLCLHGWLTGYLSFFRSFCASSKGIEGKYITSIRRPVSARDQDAEYVHKEFKTDDSIGTARTHTHTHAVSLSIWLCSFMEYIALNPFFALPHRTFSAGSCLTNLASGLHIPVTRDFCRTALSVRIWIREPCPLCCHSDITQGTGNFLSHHVRGVDTEI